MDLDYDEVLEHIGQFGLWQIMVCLLASLAAMAASFTTFQVGNFETYLALARGRLSKIHRHFFLKNIHPIFKAIISSP